MSIDTDVKTLEVDSNSLYKTQKIKFSSSKSITTPTKTIPLDKIRVKDTLNPKSRRLNEIFKRFTENKIKTAYEDAEKFDELETWFNSQMNKVWGKTPTLCFIDFAEKRLPRDDEIEFMTDLTYCYSDISTIPTVSYINKSKQIEYDDFKNYLKKTIEIIEQLNNKPIMGIIPKLAPKNVPDLIEFYQAEGINSYALDLAGSNPISSSLRIFKVLKKLNKMKVLEKTYLHGHNIGMRVNKAAGVIPAKDILGFGTGLSSLGEKRTLFKPNRAFLEKVKLDPKNKFRLFNKEDYGYWKSISLEELEKVCPGDCSFSLAEFTKPSQVNYLQRAFNAEQLALESYNLRRVIKRHPEDTLDYVKTKQYVDPDDISLLEKGNKKIS